MYTGFNYTFINVSLYNKKIFFSSQVKPKFLSTSANSDRLRVDNSSCHVMTVLSKHNVLKLAKKCNLQKSHLIHQRLKPATFFERSGPPGLWSEGGNFKKG